LTSSFPISHQYDHPVLKTPRPLCQTLQTCEGKKKKKTSDERDPVIILKHSHIPICSAIQSFVCDNLAPIYYSFPSTTVFLPQYRFGSCSSFLCRLTLLGKKFFITGIKNIVFFVGHESIFRLVKWLLNEVLEIIILNFGGMNLSWDFLVNA